MYYDYSSVAPVTVNIIDIRPLDNDGHARSVLILDNTVFFPEGGGQASGRGWINGFPVMDVQEKDGEILHIISAEGGAMPTPGPAEAVLDAARRRDFTVQHTGQHLLSGTILRLTGKNVVSMHLGEDVNTIDVEIPQLNQDILTKVEDAVMEAIERDYPVIVHLCPPGDVRNFPLRKVQPQGEEVIRVIEITENDFSPCCGTHCASTGQIGMLLILGAEKYKGMTRVSFIAGRRALHNSRLLCSNAAAISCSLKVPLGETGSTALALLEKAGLLSGGTVLPAAGKVLLETFANAGIEAVLRTGRAAQKHTGAVLVFVSKKDNKFAAFCSDKRHDICPLLTAAFEKAGDAIAGGGNIL